MDTIQKLLPDYNGKILELQAMKKSGKKIIAYVPNGYIPEELVYACGAIPVALDRGGDPAPVAASASCLARFLDPFCRAQIGYRLLKEEALYQLPDLLVVPVTDNHVRAIADSWDFYTDVEVFRFGVPHVKAKHGIEYYIKGLQVLKDRLEDLTGNKIEDSSLIEEIGLANQIRDLLKEISFMRRSAYPPISGKEFIELSQLSLLTDRHALLDILRSVRENLKSSEPERRVKPRLLLAGSTMALGDTKIVDLLEESGASVVMEEFSEGLRNYRNNVTSTGDPLKAMADCYFTGRIPDAFFRGAAEERVKFLLDLMKDFKADGMVYYTLMYRDSYDVEGYILHRTLEKSDIPILRLSSDYDVAETSGFRTRIETFVSTIQKE
ncbi:MAG: 2-hydroxyacyl-CoA dehydratase [Dehalococcoidales bacterium]|nr:2-hydroxyacyl-CoA dehydratase [Dehalococcoidales bacterium]